MGSRKSSIIGNEVASCGVWLYHMTAWRHNLIYEAVRSVEGHITQPLEAKCWVAETQPSLNSFIENKNQNIEYCSLWPLKKANQKHFATSRCSAYTQALDRWVWRTANIGFSLFFWSNFKRFRLEPHCVTMMSDSYIGLTFAFTIMVLTDLIGNTLVILVVMRNKSMQTPFHYLLCNLAIADILVAVFIAVQFISGPLYTHPDGALGKFLCKFITGGTMTWTGAVSSVFSLVAISVERYYAVLFPHSQKGRIGGRSLK